MTPEHKKYIDELRAAYVRYAMSGGSSKSSAARAAAMVYPYPEPKYNIAQSGSSARTRYRRNVNGYWERSARNSDCWEVAEWISDQFVVDLMKCLITPTISEND